MIIPDKDEVPGSSPDRPTTLLPAQSAAAPRPVASTACLGASGPHALRAVASRPSRSRPPSAQVMVGLMPAIMALTTCAAMPQMGEPRRVPGSLPTSGPCPTGSSLVGQAVKPGRWPRTSLRPRPSRCLRWPNTACASLERQAPTRADDQPVVDTVRGDHADHGHPRGVLLAASARLTNSPGSDTADAERRIADARCPDARTPNLDTGHRTPDAGRLHRTADTRTPGRHTGHTGHRTPVAWTPHAWTLDLTPDTGRRMLLRPDRLTRHGQLRIFWAITPSGCPLGCRTVFLRTAPAALGVPCRLGGEATCQCAKLPIALSAAARSLRRPSGALGALLSSDDFGSRVERQAAGQVL